MTWITIVVAILKGVARFLGLLHDNQLRSDGAAQQRADDWEIENARINDAVNAGRIVDGLHDEQTDPYNRDNIK